MHSLQEIKKAIMSDLPRMMETEPEIRDLILRLTREMYAGKQETNDRFAQMLEELKRDREASERRWQAWEKKWDENLKAQREQWEAWEKKWEENQKAQREQWEAWEKKWEENQKAQREQWEAQEKKWEAQEKKWEENLKAQREQWEAQEKKWEAQEKKWEENQKVINSMLQRIEEQNKKHESSIGALGARWGLYSEAAFRNGLRAILEDSFGVTVQRYEDYDYEGQVFGRPDQIEMDVIIHNGTLILCEIKSSFDKAGMYAFWRKRNFYQQKQGREVSRTIAISPMIDDRAKRVAEELGIETYSYPDRMELTLE
ncbi:MAG: DUF3782 domain-containing protein [Desulfovermiculus sp.]